MPPKLSWMDIQFGLVTLNLLVFSSCSQCGSSTHLFLFSCLSLLLKYSFHMWFFAITSPSLTSTFHFLFILSSLSFILIFIHFSILFLSIEYSPLSLPSSICSPFRHFLLHLQSVLLPLSLLSGSSTHFLSLCWFSILLSLQCPRTIAFVLLDIQEIYCVSKWCW